MLRRRETSSASASQYGIMPISSAPSTYTTPLPVVRNHSVATSTPSLHEHVNTVRSYFSSSRNSCLDSQFPSRKNKGANKNIWLYYIPAVLLLLAPWLFSHNINDDIKRYKNEVLEFQEQQRSLVKHIDNLTKGIQEKSTLIHSLNKENEARYKEIRKSGDVQVNMKSQRYEEIERTEEGLLNRVDVLERDIQKTSAQLAAHNFGSAPYQVKVSLSDIRDVTSSFVVELAPLSEMPHAVYHFLQMVDRNLWEGLSFMLGSGTAMGISTGEAPADYWVAQPLAMDIKHGRNSWEIGRFEAANLTQLAFTEHSANYPAPGKYKYSVAFSGHPGGPGFYIRMDDAEESAVDIHQQPSTFGTVVEGVDVLERYWKKSGHVDHRQRRSKTGSGVFSTHSEHLELLTITSMELIRPDTYKQ